MKQLFLYNLGILEGLSRGGLGFMAEKNISIAADRDNPNLILILLLLNKWGYVSGEDISKKLGVTRSAIWKQVNNLREMGYEIESSTRLGYRLVNSPDLILPEEIWSKAKLELLGKNIHYFSSIGSTNEKAKKLAISGAPSGTLVVAEQQTSGKGRLGRQWVSPSRTGICVSIILRPEMAPYEAPKLTLLTAVAACETIRKQTGLLAQIKWPNDILIDGKKICGILTEISAELDRINYVVIGIGINVNNYYFPEELIDRATSLSLILGRKLNRKELLVGFLESFESHYNLALKDNFKEVMTKWRKLSCNLGRHVKITGKAYSFEGNAIDIDDEGALLVKKDNGEIERVFSGDVSLR